MLVSSFFLLLSICVPPKLASEGNVCNNPGTTHVTVLESTETQLTCNTSESSPNDRLQLIVWYKDSSNNPFYSVDVRNKSLVHADHIVHSQRVRMYFNQTAAAAYLLIPNAQPGDQGDYCCRVDYLKSPTRYYAINLSVITPPSPPVITDERGMRLGPIPPPYDEGSPLYLSCKVEKGQPRASVTWWRNGVPVPDDDTRQFVSSGIVRNDLTVPSLPPTHFNTTYTCRASNTNLTSPSTTSVTIDMNLKPVRVQIQRPLRPLSAHRKCQLRCQSVGARPEAVITWWLGRIKLLTAEQYTTLNGTTTESVLTLVPSSTDHGKQLVCTAHNPLVPNSDVHDNWTLNIYYRPVVAVELTAPADQSNIAENDDVFFECHVASNPFVLAVTWKFKSANLENSPEAGVTVSEQSLVIQSVQPQHAGAYVCVATNSEGEGQSEPFNLQIRHKPVCSEQQQTTYAFARDNQTRAISCRVEARPPNVTFHWTSASAKGTKTLLPVQPNSDQTSSSVLYTVNSDSDLGRVSCWATNQIGTQTKHCVFQIVFAEKPHPLENCTVYDVGDSSLRVRCVDNHEDELPRNFTIQVHDGATARLIKAETKPDANFYVTELEPEQKYIFNLYATTIEGNGDPVQLTAQTLKSERNHTLLNEGKNNLSAIPEWHMTSAFLAFLLAIVVATVCLLKYKKRQMQQQLTQNLKTPLYPSEQHQEEITYRQSSKRSKSKPRRSLWPCCNTCNKQERRVYDACPDSIDHRDEILSRPKQWRQVRFQENLQTLLLTNAKRQENTTAEFKHEQRRQSWIEMNF